MTAAILSKLLALFVAAAIGFVVGRMRWLGEPFGGTDPARVLGHAAFTIFVPALLFRTTARLDLYHMPWVTLAAFFVPVIGLLLAVYAAQRWRWRHHRADAVEDSERAAARPATRAIAAVFGNTVQIGIPLAAGVFGEAGLGIHITVVGLHALVLLSVLTVLVELDLARARARHEATATLMRTLAVTARNTIVHPVVLPVLAGMGWNLAALPLPGPLDETLALLGTAVSPLCLVLIGISLAYTRVGGALRAALPGVLLKLIAQPALVLVAARWGFGLTGLPLSVVVTMAALPSGSNALLFAQRYGALEAETTATIVISTFAFVVTAPLWLALLAHLA